MIDSTLTIGVDPVWVPGLELHKILVARVLSGLYPHENSTEIKMNIITKVFSVLEFAISTSEKHKMYQKQCWLGLCPIAHFVWCCLRLYLF